MQLINRGRVLAVVAALAAGGCLLPTPARADTVGPAIALPDAAMPVIGSVLSNSSTAPGVALKWNWAISDPDGVCSVQTSVARQDVISGAFQPYSTSTSFGSASTTSMSKQFRWSARVGRPELYEVTGTDCNGASSTAGDYYAPTLTQEMSGTYSAGWTTASYSGWSGGQVLKSSTLGASAVFEGGCSRSMSLVSDKASNRGSVAIYFRVPDYGTSWNHLGTVSLKSATNKNRVIVANIGGWSPQFDSCKGYEVKFKVASGRVDIDAVLLDETAYEYE